MRTYKVNVTRDDKWWMITVPELDGYVTADGAINLSDTTQARRLSDVPKEAADFICTVTDSAPSAVKLDITISVDGIDVTDRRNRVANDRELAERHAAAAQAEARQLARDLAAHGVAVRDVGEVLGVSFQRAQQLISA
ncbi:HicB family toxin-antitoxin system [Mycolicibacterium goodii]|uniref:HicB family toxin-antitoxin system n=1 Tax=Mycolicibacterium goodii TaxID=134601 RepID=A0ABS6HS32_MYCGD|nr:HicB family toxin-antitoxin system [Mycolicibacterium goodii]MBU8824138.1 HicB family toxin-antitoxin system [Mycolicibacterium goodii]MBU8838079.1 HicB family toxin-antitoxin system [Mycolicibacterium goodii]